MEDEEWSDSHSEADNSEEEVEDSFSEEEDDVEQVTQSKDKKKKKLTKLPLLGFPAVTKPTGRDGDEEEEEVYAPMKKKGKTGGFQSMNLNFSLLKAITKKGYKVPTPIQRKCIPIALEGRDLVGMARTGSGKTAAFLIPLIEKLKTHSAKPGARGLVLSPSRELALQTLKFCKELCKYSDLRVSLLVGGDSMEDQFLQLTGNPDVIVATPGRFIHVITEMDLSLKSIEYIVFDEADRLFESGLAPQLYEILQKLPEDRQTLLFSATLPKLLVDFAKLGLRDPVLVRLDSDTKISSDLEMAFFSLKKDEKIPFLLYLLQEIIDQGKLTIIFVSTKHHVEYLQQILTQAGISCTYIYGALDQTARKINLAKFRNSSLDPNESSSKNRCSVLIVTDVASRGLDVPLLDFVINFDFPPKPKLFVHRVGRAARAGRSGTAYSLISPEEIPYLIDLQLFLGKPFVTDCETETDLKSNIVFGEIPRFLLQRPTEEFINIKNNSVDISSLEKVVTNGYNLYCKSRPLASKESYSRSKKLSQSPLGIHPLFKQRINDTEIQVQQFLNGIKSFRPNETVFELGKNKQEELVMQRKREAHRAKVRPVASASIDQPKKEPAKEKNQELEMADEELLRESFSKFIAKEKKKPVEDWNAPASKSHRDEEYYIHYRPSDHDTERGYSMEENSFFSQARDAVIDFTGEDSTSIQKQKNSMVWDRKKKKFVKNQDPKNSKSAKRNEAGQIIKSSHNTNRYQDWKAKNRIGEKGGEDEEVKMVKLHNGRWVPRRKRGAEEIYSKQIEEFENSSGPNKKSKNSETPKGNEGNGGKRKSKAQMGDVKRGDNKLRREMKPIEKIKKERRIQEMRNKKNTVSMKRKNQKGKGKGKGKGRK